MDYQLEPVTTPRGNSAMIAVRDGTSDLSIVFGTFSGWAAGDDEYHLAGLQVEGWFLDIGAHVGTIGLAVLVDNPLARVVFVEPFPENVALIRASLAANGLTERATVIEAAVGVGHITYGAEGVGDRFVGNIGTHDGASIEARIVTLDELVADAGHVAAMKIDCEGGEWAFLDSRALRGVDLIFGEWHGHGSDFSGPVRLAHLLESTHDITEITDVGGIGLFRAVRR